MSCIVLNVGPSDKKVIRELGIFFNGKFSATHLVLQKLKTKKQVFWSIRKLQGILRNSGCFDYNELAINFPGDVEGDYFAQ